MSEIGNLNQFKITSLEQVPKMRDRREGTSFSFRPGGGDRSTPKLDPCLNLNIAISKDFLEEKGRSWFDIVLYDPEQIENFPSQYSRYEKALDLRPDRVIERDNKPVWQFCQSGSPDFWEVTQAGLTYLYLPKGTFVIICPVPWRLSALGFPLSTDGTDGEVKWIQEQGRSTQILTDTLVDPVFFTNSPRSPLDPPILIRVEAIGQPELFDYLAVDPLPRSLASVISSAQVANWEVDPTKKVTQYVLLPRNVEIAYQWTGQPLWTTYLPPQETDALRSVEIFETTPGWATLGIVARWLSYPGRFYRATTQYNFPPEIEVLGDSFGLPVLPNNTKWVFADNFPTSLSAAVTDFGFDTVVPALKVINNSDRVESISSVAVTDFGFDTIAPAVKSLSNSDRIESISSVAVTSWTFAIEPGSGIIIG
jgi:hypothetical protein